MSVALPSWANSSEGRELVAAIVTEQPSYYITHGGWLEGGGQRRYQGPTAGKLRRLYKRETERLYDEATEANDEGLDWEAAAAEFNAAAIVTPDQLIEQLLQAPGERIAA